MINEALHRITNRTGPFQSDFLNADPRFVPKDESEEMTALRKALFLDREDTDYYIKNYLSLLAGYPDLEGQFDQENKTYDLKGTLPNDVEINGGDFYSRPPGIAGRFTDPAPDGLPVPLEYRIFYWDDHNVRIRQVDRQWQHFAEYTLSQSEPHQILQCRWPTGVPFEGPIRLHQPWVQSASIEIRVAPSQFPYSEMVKRVERHRIATELLVIHGTVDAYYGSPEDAERLAILLTLIGLENRKRS